MKARWYTLAILGALLGGCVSMSAYRDPESGPRARVRFVADTWDVSVLYKYADAECKTGEQEMMRLHAGSSFNRSPPRRLGMPLWQFHDNEAQEVYVTPGPFYGRFEGGVDAGLTTFTCKTPFSFAPEAGHDYEVRFVVSPPKCGVEIAEIRSTGGSESIRVPMAGNQLPPDACMQHRLRLL